MLWDYNQSLGIYHCPTDRSTLTDPGGVSGDLRARSYNMSQSVNGYPEYEPYLYTNLPCFKKLTEMQAPLSANCFVFIDENEYILLDAQFGMSPGYWNWSPTWWDMPADRHFQGANLSFADGHAEHWRWFYPKQFRSWVGTVAPKEMDDYMRLRGAMKQAS